MKKFLYSILLVLPLSMQACLIKLTNDLDAPIRVISALDEQQLMQGGLNPAEGHFKPQTVRAGSTVPVGHSDVHAHFYIQTNDDKLYRLEQVACTGTHTAYLRASSIIDNQFGRLNDYFESTEENEIKKHAPEFGIKWSEGEKAHGKHMTKPVKHISGNGIVL